MVGSLSGATGIALRTGRLKYLDNHSDKMGTLIINCESYCFLICSLFNDGFINSFEWFDDREQWIEKDVEGGDHGLM
jgi:hypothetical protein